MTGAGTEPYDGDRGGVYVGIGIMFPTGAVTAPYDGDRGALYVGKG